MMLRLLTEDEVKEGELRKSFLYGSAFTIDNLTAILMDTSTGSFGMYEETARAKAHAVIDWMKTIAGVKIPDRRNDAQG